jgi:hypothetical protein
MEEHPAISHDPDCPHCGHRIVRSLRELAEYIMAVARSGIIQSTFMNHEKHNSAGVGFAISECFVPAGGTIAYRNLANAELQGTLRADQLQLGERVHLPKVFGTEDQTQLALYIRFTHRGVKPVLHNTDALALVSSYLEPGSPTLKSVLAKQR